MDRSADDPEPCRHEGRTWRDGLGRTRCRECAAMLHDPADVARRRDQVALTDATRGQAEAQHVSAWGKVTPGRRRALTKSEVWPRSSNTGTRSAPRPSCTGRRTSAHGRGRCPRSRPAPPRSPCTRDRRRASRVRRRPGRQRMRSASIDRQASRPDARRARRRRSSAGCVRPPPRFPTSGSSCR